MSEPQEDAVGWFVGQGKRLCPLITFQRQRVILAMLYRELAVAVRCKCPLDLTLASIAASPRLRPGARYVHGVGLVVLIAIVAALTIAGMPYGFSGQGSRNVAKIGPFSLLHVIAMVVAVAGGLTLFLLSVSPHDDFLRFVADRLARAMDQGLVLSEAMLYLPLVFTRQERRTVATGERTARLAESLETLAAYNMMASELNRLIAAILYPLMVLTFCLGIVSFIVARIYPKYVDVFTQLGAELPAPTLFIASGPVASFFVWAIGSLVIFPFLILVVLFLVVPRAVGGNVKLTVLFLFFVSITALSIFLPVVISIPSGAMSGLAVGLAICATVGASFAAAIGLYLAIRWTSGIFPRTMRLVGAWFFGWLGPLRKLELSRFLFGLGFSLRSGIPVPEAVEMAGEATHGPLRRESRRMRAIVEQGHSLSDALESSRLFRGKVGAVLSLADWRGAVADDCIELAEQLRAEAQRSGERFAMLIEWPAIILVGIFLGAFVIACYLPLFSIPTLVK